MKNKTTTPPWYKMIGPAGIWPVIVIIAVSVLTLIIITPASAIGTVSLPNEVKPVAVEVDTPVSQTPTPAPLPTATPAPSPTITGTGRVIKPRNIPDADFKDPTATPVAKLPPLTGLTPRRLRIPSLGINAYVEQVGLDDKKRMDVPRNIWNVAWYQLGPKPGERGNAVIDGHVDGPNTPAVFWTLSKIQVGSRIFVQDEKSQEKVFEVYEIGTYAYDKAPLDRIFGSNDEAQLNLITCTGTFDETSLNYDKRFVAYSRWVEKP